mmetsp:Transcript_8193/g.16938  ORF Transcript_8193/g.16938 Transcript_8193/m.16938 type:complete len:87 (-) Transcript_8193:1255-1515(-)
MVDVTECEYCSGAPRWNSKGPTRRESGAPSSAMRSGQTYQASVWHNNCRAWNNLATMTMAEERIENKQYQVPSRTHHILTLSELAE